MSWPAIILGVVIIIALFCVLELTRRWQLNRRINSIVKRVKSENHTKRPSDIYIVISEGDFEIRQRSASGIKAARWSEVVRITAFKRDLWSYDSICVAFEFPDRQSIEIDETMDGFLEAMELASKKCAGCIPPGKWYQEIMVPAFETKLTELYRKPFTTSEVSQKL